MNIGSKKAAMAIIGATMVAAVSMSAPAASAAGTSGTYNGCYAQWWNTAAAGYCNNAPGFSAGLTVYCNGWDSNYYGSIKWLQGTIRPFDSTECTFSVDHGSLEVP